MFLSVRRVLATAAATATILALAGCGSDDGKAAEKSSSTLSASGSASPAGAGSGEEMSADEFAGLLQDALDKATTTHVTMDLGAIGSGEGDADYTKSPPELAMKMTMDALGGGIELRLVDGSMYMKSSTFGDKWIALSLDDPNNPLGELGSQLDVKKQIEVFADSVTSATYNGAEDVDGESLDHYTATIDTTKLLQNLPSEAAGQAERARVDEPGLVVRQRRADPQVLHRLRRCGHRHDALRVGRGRHHRGAAQRRGHHHARTDELGGLS